MRRMTIIVSTLLVTACVLQGCQAPQRTPGETDTAYTERLLAWQRAIDTTADGIVSGGTATIPFLGPWGLLVAGSAAGAAEMLRRWARGKGAEAVAKSIEGARTTNSSARTITFSKTKARNAQGQAGVLRAVERVT